jgi:hypothetical protein
MQPRYAVWQYGLLPLHTLCPQLDSANTLLLIHGRLSSRSIPSAAGGGERELRSAGRSAP